MNLPAAGRVLAEALPRTHSHEQDALIAMLPYFWLAVAFAAGLLAGAAGLLVLQRFRRAQAGRGWK